MATSELSTRGRFLTDFRAAVTYIFQPPSPRMMDVAEPSVVNIIGLQPAGQLKRAMPLSRLHKFVLCDLSRPH